jgi:hypothetical protein
LAGEPERRGYGPLQDVVVELGSTGIQLLSETASFCIFARDNLIALVERRADGYGGIGSTGIMMERGLAYLIWRDGQPFLAGKGFEERAADAQVLAVRSFSEDLKAAL